VQNKQNKQKQADGLSIFAEWCESALERFPPISTFGAQPGLSRPGMLRLPSSRLSLAAR